MTQGLSAVIGLKKSRWELSMPTPELLAVSIRDFPVLSKMAKTSTDSMAAVNDCRVFWAAVRVAGLGSSKAARTWGRLAAMRTLFRVVSKKSLLFW